MRNGEDNIYFGLFTDFAEPTVVFSGTDVALKRFARLLREADRSTGRKLLHELSQVIAVRNTRVTLAIEQVAGGMKRAHPSFDDNELEWIITPDIAKEFAALVEAVAESKSPSHHYLDSNSLDQVQVIVSKGEYDDLLR